MMSQSDICWDKCISPLLFHQSLIVRLVPALTVATVQSKSVCDMPEGLSTYHPFHTMQYLFAYETLFFHTQIRIDETFVCIVSDQY